MNQNNLIYYTLISILAITFFAVFFPVLKGLVGAWQGSEEYSHGFLIIPLCLYIIWQKKDELVQISMQPSNWGLSVIIFFLLAFIVAQSAEILTLSSLSMVFIIIGIVLYLFGFLICKKLFFPLFFLFFMIPVPGQIYSALTIPLQLFVSQTTEILVSLIGVPIFREGNVIHIPDHTMQVVQACSGLRSMISLLTLGAVFGYFTLRSNVLRSFLFVAGVPISIIVNIFRVFLMILAYYYFNYDLTTGYVHTAFGMTIFLLALILIAAIQGVLSIWDIPTTKE